LSGQKGFGHHQIHHRLVNGVILCLNDFASLIQIFGAKAFLHLGLAVFEVKNFAATKQCESIFHFRAT
jgi:hypothetical protein